MYTQVTSKCGFSEYKNNAKCKRKVWWSYKTLSQGQEYFKPIKKDPEQYHFMVAMN
jgi:hypothetical protein